MNRLAFLCLVAVLMICGRPSSGCSCGFLHPQSHFCTADFVVKATIMEEELEFGHNKKSPSMKHYKVQYKKRNIFKGEHLLGSKNEAVINTYGNRGSCGETFSLNTKYLISGYVKDGELFTDTCDWNTEFSKLKQGNHLKRRGLRRMYERGCNCTVLFCHGDECSYLPGHEATGLNPDHVCTGKGTYNTHKCYVNFGFCLPDSFGLCSWKNNRKLSRCLNSDPESRR